MATRKKRRLLHGTGAQAGALIAVCPAAADVGAALPVRPRAAGQGRDPAGISCLGRWNDEKEGKRAHQQQDDSFHGGSSLMVAQTVSSIGYSSVASLSSLVEEKGRPASKGVQGGFRSRSRCRDRDQLHVPLRLPDWLLR